MPTYWENLTETRNCWGCGELANHRLADYEGHTEYIGCDNCKANVDKTQSDEFRYQFVSRTRLTNGFSESGLESEL